ncbi:alpha/beta hydrolase [Vineibacter terrae]|uniref:Alpha/beta hydrolase n=1 Tax=Vineibacter terrae TaxID=2586908 RepID=A0A5C8PMB8_9HYPH|nr:alpha/beta hydrolase [Vineibacter terrae]TXL75454.1 alpha/beta hydrolase [Vineibacter terrae]
MLTEHVAETSRHKTFYLAAGPRDGPLIIFVHGWPELSLSWRHQLPCMASLGFRAIAPDMRGYGRSGVYRTHADYAQEHIVADMIELLDALGAASAVWVGHDWGSPVVWNIASHHPDRCRAVASLCVPYYSLERGLDFVIPLVDRRVYPESEFPAGQWEYMRFYEENFATATKQFEANPYNMVKAIFRKGNPTGVMQPAVTAFARQHAGWFRGLPAAPDLPRDPDVVSEEDLRVYAEALERNGFFGPDSYYMNHKANALYAETAVNGGRLDMPVLFLAARYDYVCETVESRLAEPMRAHCRNLTTEIVASGHWMAQERPLQVNAALARWLATRVPQAWPTWPDK